MFTGLVEQIGYVNSISERDFGIRLAISLVGWDQLPLLGASISVSGCCLTVVHAERCGNETLLSFDIILETIECTTLGAFRVGDTLNVEQSLRADSLVGGHFVQGHVDCIESVVQFSSVDSGECRARVSMNFVDKEAVIPKGSITIDGVSLTIATVEENWFEVVLIPATLQDTTLGNLEVGKQVNIETDMIVRSVVRVVKRMNQINLGG